MSSGRTAPTPEDRSRAEAVLEEGARIFDEIAALCATQREALARHDLDALAALAERAETLASRFRLLECGRTALEAAGALDDPALARSRGVLTEAAARAALAASSCADLLARSSSASAALLRVLEGAESAGYLPNGEVRPTRRPRKMETTA